MIPKLIGDIIFVVVDNKNEVLMTDSDLKKIIQYVTAFSEQKEMTIFTLTENNYQTSKEFLEYHKGY